MKGLRTTHIPSGSTLTAPISAAGLVGRVAVQGDDDSDEWRSSARPPIEIQRAQAQVVLVNRCGGNNQQVTPEVMTEFKGEIAAVKSPIETALRSGKGFGPVIAELAFRVVHAIAGINVNARTLAALRDRVEQLEARRPLQYCGVFDDGGEYAENDLVTHDGSLWIALRETKARPGSDDSWQLCVKRGRDGRDAR